VITSVLIANRGEIARRIIRGARSMGIRCVGVYVDADTNSPYVTECDEAVRLATGYLDADAILTAAKRAHVTAVHPGYGFLSENAAFARQVEEAGLTWVGPPSRVIAAMGDKLAAKEMATKAGVVTLPSSEDATNGDAVGYPLMVKAVGGGGGKGMRIVEGEKELDDAVAAARREARAGFDDERVFLERYVASSRHVEVQILGDRHGHVIHLGERECSIQRRHQKLIEESPSPYVDQEMRDQMTSAALKIARALDYESAGTVEFLVDNDTGDFYFLEVNARLQVEHPVSEEVTGVDLVREQFRVANGEELDCDQEDVYFDGHAIEVRLCAEDPAAGFLPATGTIVAFEAPDEPSVRWESGVERGSVVSVAFDPLLAKVISYAPTRAEAAAVLALALERLHLGGVVTNRDFLAATLRHEGFLAGDTTTDFIDRYGPARTLDLSDTELRTSAIAGALWLQGEHRANAPVLGDAPSGWRNARLPPQRTTLRWGDTTVDVDYRRHRDGTFSVPGGRVRFARWSPTGIELEVDGLRANARVTRDGASLYVQCPRGTVAFEIVPRFEVHGVEIAHGGLTAPMPGLIIDVRVEPGQRVSAGETLVVMEAMKMEHVIAARGDGTVTSVMVVAGQQVEGGASLLSIDPDEMADR
jgi:propionyl-CoA carboxylase alpha chain